MSDAREPSASVARANRLDGQLQVPRLRKRDWPGHIADLLGIEPVMGLVAPFVSNGDTTDEVWFHRVGEVLGVGYPGERVAAMRSLVERVGEVWDEARCASTLTPSGGGGNIQVEAFRRLYRGLHQNGYITGSLASGREPNWTWDEIILAFDLYLDVSDARVGNPAVVELSEFLGQLDLHPPAVRGPSFRSPASVSRKLADIHTSSPNYAGKATHAGQLDRKVWEVFGESPDTARQLASAIREGGTASPPPADDEDEFETREGRVVYRVHRHRERNSGLRTRKVKAVISKFGRLQCEACDTVLSEQYGETGDLAYECHHLVPLHVTGQTTTRLRDVALLCPTCHRVAHRIEPWPSLQHLRTLASRGRVGSAAPG